MMNKKIVMAAIGAAIAIGIVIGVAGTTGAFAPSSQANSGGNTNQQPTTPRDNTNSDLSGSVVIDGSSTVYPITEVIAEQFSDANPAVSTTVAVSGTGGGFKRFVVGETDVNDSSRPITESEKTTSATNNVNWVEIPVALEGLTIVVHPENNLIQDDCITIDQLKGMWQPERTITRWSDLDPSNPNQQIRLYGAGPDSGTFDYFTERVVGQARSSTTDYIPSEDDNVLVQGVANDRYALGYIPLAYVEEADNRLKILRVSDDGGCILPGDETVTSGEYPLARPLFIHVNYDKLQDKPELQAFVEFYLTNAMEAVQRVGYVTLPEEYYDQALSTMKKGTLLTPNDQETFNSLY